MTGISLRRRAYDRSVTVAPTHSRRSFVRFVAVLGAACLVVGGCSDDDPPPAATSSARSEPARTSVRPTYLLAPTLRCLERSTRISTTRETQEPRLRALRDLAQQTSVIASVGAETVGLAVVASPAHARLLADLLKAPDDPSRIAVRHNAVLVFLPRARAASNEVAACLRPSG
jgi:hypothetical protein